MNNAQNIKNADSPSIGFSDLLCAAAALTNCIENSANGIIVENGSQIQQVCKVITRTWQFMELKEQVDKNIKSA